MTRIQPPAPVVRGAPVATLVASIMLALTACGGGGGGGMVRASQPPTTPPPPQPATPPPASTGEACPMPITGPCTITTLTSLSSGRTSAYSLEVRGGALGLGYAWGSGANPAPATYTFNGGTTVGPGDKVNQGTLVVYFGNTLVSDVRVQPGGEVYVSGTSIGGIHNQGVLFLGGKISGDVVNHGLMEVQSGSPMLTGWPISNLIDGDFTQGSTGTLSVSLPTTASISDYVYTLNVTGHAQLDGVLLLRTPSDGWDVYPLPTTPTSAHVLHATGGVSGTFDRWTSPGLFIEGRLRYDPSDVWFDLTRVSVQATSAAAGITAPRTLASAGNLDRALASADRVAATPRSLLSTAQRQLLDSASRILHQQDWTQATRTLDSLAGQDQAMLGSRLRGFNADAAERVGDRLALRSFSREPTAWTAALDGGRVDGIDRWLGPRLLLGGSVARRSDADALAFGSSRFQDDLASVYLHYRGDHWQATGVLTGARSRAQVQRRIDLGDRLAHRVHGQRDLDLLGLHGELSRPMALAGGVLQPFAGLDHGVLHSRGFQEFGDTGFELLAPGARLHQLDGATGMRYLRQWRLGNGWLDLHASLQREHALAGADLMPVAFTGAPEAMFDLRDWSWPGARTSATLSLQADAGHGWRWSLQGEHGHRDRGRNGWQFALVRGL